jgi:hypothetical protein
MTKTIQETIDQLHTSLKEYIEATYHIGDPVLIAQRRALLNRIGVTHQIPYLESTPKYQLGQRFCDMKGLPGAARAVYEALAKAEGDNPRLLFDPPYRHQGEAIRGALIEGKNLVIMTGTGSGKTESFLLPILGKFAREAADRPQAFASQRAMRALLLYPMNALVNDQLGRLRAIFGDPRLVQQFDEWAGRPPTFARYTSRTPYAGTRLGKRRGKNREVRDGKKLASFENFYVEIERQASGPASEEQAKAATLKKQLRDRGKWPAKPDLMQWFGAKNSNWLDRKTGQFLRAVTLPGDSELITRHESQEAAPDLLVTNYSMLEYMLMRPIERSARARGSPPIRMKTLPWCWTKRIFTGAPPVPKLDCCCDACGIGLVSSPNASRSSVRQPASAIPSMRGTSEHNWRVFQRRDLKRLPGISTSGPMQRPAAARMRQCSPQ